MCLSFCRVYSLCQWAVWPSETFPRGVLVVAVLVPAPRGRKRRSALVPWPARAPNLTAKRGLKAPFVAKFGAHLEKKSHVARGGGCGIVGGPKKSHVALGGVWGNKKKSPMSHLGVCGVLEKKKLAWGGAVDSGAHRRICAARLTPSGWPWSKRP